MAGMKLCTCDNHAIRGFSGINIDLLHTINAYDSNIEFTEIGWVEVLIHFETIDGNK